jgi:hypothetical protein
LAVDSKRCSFICKFFVQRGAHRTMAWFTTDEAVAKVKKKGGGGVEGMESVDIHLLPALPGLLSNFFQLLSFLGANLPTLRTLRLHMSSTANIDDGFSDRRSNRQKNRKKNRFQRKIQKRDSKNADALHVAGADAVQGVQLLSPDRGFHAYADVCLPTGTILFVQSSQKSTTGL